MNPEVKSFVNTASKGAETFVKLYYDFLDKNRTMLNAFYRDSSLIVINGKAFQGFQSYNTYLTSIPTTKHTVDTFNAHPLPISNANGGGHCISVTVSGRVSFGTQTTQPRTFYHSFILVPDVSTGSTHFVGNETYRLL
ncbi:NTF2-like protein [Conidiobolus coronatus NRRL 28638]|uniref:NTF2-related export protein n=1 Tax=Conidiobolus coronatus (strain ATCC 28846 / CBS 209.66 / NRRL 28638) TaxID=796925 RepID=A0A137NT05_CONC2|nr:NTF2-like protein [Conidiobolus coronatus NRRL 28638]|eukprot:KXN65838.1 NTF2-like protein [Conidiobolus coronatus NRRL 28638]